MENKELQKLYLSVDKCKFCKKDKNPLQHIHGFGALKPNLMLILINPTYRNLSSDPKYTGIRFPFIGVRQFWKVLADGGLINEKIAYSLPLRSEWRDEHTEEIKKELINNKLFLTNIVKCCYNHGFYPKKEVVEEQLKILREEIRIVKPKRIIAFGAFTYKTLTGKNIKLSNYKNTLEIVSERISGLEIQTIPCYFPIGQGSPKKSAEMMKKIQKLF
jgi:hypothetical protein